MTFIDNKYTRFYFALIDKRKKNPLLKTEAYCESHHVIPKSLGGDNNTENIVNLTAREHYIAHKLLTKMTTGLHKQKMWWAFHRIIHSDNSEFKINSKNYELFRKTWSKLMSTNHPSKTTDHWSKNVSKAIKKSWENDQDRRDKSAKTMSTSIKTWQHDNPELFSESQRSKALKSKIKNCDTIEFNGHNYIGWAEFQRATGYTKIKFVKYHLNGIPINFREGSNGPMNLDEMHQLIEYFCNHINEKKPTTRESYENIFLRMTNIALLTEKQKDYFLNKVL